MEGGRINGGGVREIAHEGIENRRADDRRGLREEGREGGGGEKKGQRPGAGRNYRNGGRTVRLEWKGEG